MGMGREGDGNAGRGKGSDGAWMGRGWEGGECIELSHGIITSLFY